MNRTRGITRIVILGLIFIGVGIAMYNGFVKDKSAVQVGREAPDFVLPTLDGQTIQLSQYRGKGVVLNFWGTWCKPCKDEMPDLEKSHQFFKDKGVVVLGVDIAESEVTVKPFIQKYNITFPILMDKKREITQLYEIGPIPTTYFIDQAGMVQKIIIGGPMSKQTILENMSRIAPK